MYEELLSDHIDNIAKLKLAQVVVKVFDETAKDVILIVVLHIVRTSIGQLKLGTYGSGFVINTPRMTLSKKGDDIAIYAADSEDTTKFFPLEVINVDWVEYK